MKRTATFDRLLLLKDKGYMKKNDAAKVDGKYQILELGEGTVRADVVIDIDDIELSHGDEYYRIIVLASTEYDLGGENYPVATLMLGQKTYPSDKLPKPGRYILPFENTTVDQKILPYVTLFLEVEGTLTKGIDFTAYIAKR